METKNAYPSSSRPAASAAPNRGPVPSSLTKRSTTEMDILWKHDNGHEELTTVPFLEIRFHCRCAECVDEWTRERRLQRNQIKPDIKPMKVEVLGRYAVQFNWSDGHRSGIYPFELLYAIAKGAVLDD